MFIDIAINPMTALQRSAMFAAMKMRDRLRFAPMERGKAFWSSRSINITSLWDEGAAWKNLARKQEVDGLLRRGATANC